MAAVARQNRPPFRGGLVENCARFRFVGGGYKSMPPEQNGHFRIESARQCTGPMLALTDDRVVVVHVIGATQVLKSMNGDAWVPYVMEHEQLPMLVLFEDDGKADLFCGMRLMDTLKQHPGLAPLLAETKKDSRHNVTGTWIKFPGYELLVAGLNEGNVSTLSWPRLWVSEAWQHGSDGLLVKAFKRADRYGDRAKILNESQASLAKTDLHRAVEKAWPVPLVWRCPACDGEQTWEWPHWNYRRPDDFVPRERRRLSVATVGGELALIQEAGPKPGTFGGMIWPDSQDGKLSLDELARAAHWECIHCGHWIQDTPAERKALCETYTQEYRRPDGTTPREVCFTIPFEAAWDNRFEKTVKNYLTAKRAKEQGNDVPLQDWFLAERALFYERGQTQALELQPVVGSYNPLEQIPNQHSVNMLVDVQKKLDAGPDEDVAGSFWVIIEAVDKLGNSRDVWRGFVTSWDDLLALQARFKVPNGRVCIDGRKWTRTIMQKAAEHFEWVEVTLPLYGRKVRARRCWMIFLGDDAPYFKHPKKGGGWVARPYSLPHEHRVTIMDNGQSASVPVYTYQWSNLAISDQLHEIMLGGEGMPKIQTLAREQLDPGTAAKERGEFTYERQINAEYRTERRGKPYWEKKRPENHYLDCRKMGLVRKQMDGLAGSVIDTEPAPEPAAAPAEGTPA